MKKSNYVVIGSLIIALILFISGTMMGGFNQLRTLYRNGELSIDVPFGKTANYVEEYTNVENMSIQAEKGVFEFIEYDGNVIKVEANNVSKKMKLYQDNNTLVIKENFGLSNLVNSHAEIKIYIPINYEFNNIDLELDAGKMTVGNLTARNIEIDVDVGDFEAQNLSTSSLELDVDAGNAEIDLLNSERIELNCDVGDIDIILSGSETDYSYDAKCDLGDITIGNYSSEGVSEKHSHHGGTRKLVADCDMGSISVKMEAK